MTYLPDRFSSHSTAPAREFLGESGEWSSDSLGSEAAWLLEYQPTVFEH